MQKRYVVQIHVSGDWVDKGFYFDRFEAIVALIDFVAGGKVARLVYRGDNVVVKAMKLCNLS